MILAQLKGLMSKSGNSTNLVQLAMVIQYSEERKYLIAQQFCKFFQLEIMI